MIHQDQVPEGNSVIHIGLAAISLMVAFSDGFRDLDQFVGLFAKFAALLAASISAYVSYQTFKHLKP